METLGWHRIDENLWINEIFYDDWKSQIEKMDGIFSADVWTNVDSPDEDLICGRHNFLTFEDAAKWAERIMSDENERNSQIRIGQERIDNQKRRFAANKFVESEERF